MSIFRRSMSCVALTGFLLIVVLPSLSQAAGWSAPLVGGGELRVDPRTNRATVMRNGVETQAWDGVHRLQNGSTLIIESGQAVPNAAILQSRRQPVLRERSKAEQWVGLPIAGYSPCERLVRRVCGLNQECSGAEACAPARQLLQTEQREREASTNPNYMTYASGQCQEADHDRAYFVSCGQTPGAGRAVLSPGQTGAVGGRRPPSACQLLVDKVCGVRGACAVQTGCDAAQQLLRMAQEVTAEQGGRSAPGANPVEHQCTEALSDEGFFKPCTGAR